MSQENLLGRDAFCHLCYFGGQHHRYGLDQEVDMILIGSNLHKVQVIGRCEFQADFLETSGSKGIPLGREILDKRLLHQHGRPSWQRGANPKICSTAGKDLPTDSPRSTYFILTTNSRTGCDTSQLCCGVVHWVAFSFSLSSFISTHYTKNLLKKVKKVLKKR